MPPFSLALPLPSRHSADNTTPPPSSSHPPQGALLGAREGVPPPRALGSCALRHSTDRARTRPVWPGVQWTWRATCHAPSPQTPPPPPSARKCPRRGARAHWRGSKRRSFLARLPRVGLPTLLLQWFRRCRCVWRPCCHHFPSTVTQPTGLPSRLVVLMMGACISVLTASVSCKNGNTNGRDTSKRASACHRLDHDLSRQHLKPKRITPVLHLLQSLTRSMPSDKRGYLQTSMRASPYRYHCCIDVRKRGCFGASLPYPSHLAHAHLACAEGTMPSRAFTWQPRGGRRSTRQYASWLL